MKKNNKGFTIVELIVSVALLALILVPIAGFFTNSFRIQGKTSMKTSITRVGQYIVENFKNKNYLGLKVDGKDLDKYLEIVRIEGLDNNITGDDGWEIEYNNVKYDVKINLKEVTEADNSSISIPKESECHGTVKIDSDGSLSASTGITIKNKGETVTDPFGTTYTADYPTVVLGNISNGETVNLWIKNNNYGYVDESGNLTKEKDIRVIKGFTEDLHIYIEGMKLGIVEGPTGGINKSKEYYKIDSLYLGETAGSVYDDTIGEVILSVEMVVSSTIDDTIKDTFEFSFPVNYDY